MSEAQEAMRLAKHIRSDPWSYLGEYAKDLRLLARQLNHALTRESILLEGIRTHMNMRGDDRCYQDDAILYGLLPEGDTRPATETAVTLENCARFIACRQQGREYVSSEREIERLRAEIASLQKRLDAR